MAKAALRFSVLFAMLSQNLAVTARPESQETAGICETAGDVEAFETFEAVTGTVNLLQTSLSVQGFHSRTNSVEDSDREDFASADYPSARGRPMPGGIPRILHQQWGDKPMPADLVAHRASWSHCLGDDWEIMLWNDTSNRELVAKHFPSFLSTFDSYDQPVKKWDVIRRVYMYLYGGVYADLDLECVKSIEPLIQSHSAVLAYAVPYCYLEAAFMASRPGHPFFKRELEGFPFTASFRVGLATGCGFLTRSFEEYTGKLDFHVVDEPQSFPAVNVSGQENAVTLLGTEHIVWDWCILTNSPGSAIDHTSDYPAAFLINHFKGSWKRPDEYERQQSQSQIDAEVLKKFGGAQRHKGCMPEESGWKCSLPKSERWNGWLTKKAILRESP